MRVKFAVLSVGIALLLTVASVHAHHPFSAQYDSAKPIKVQGTVTKVEWTNPHAHIFLDGKDENGQTANWEFELGGIKKLRDFGWKKDSVKMGDQVTVSGWRARDGSNHANANMITFTDGTKLVAGSSFYEHNKEKAPISN